MCLQLCLCTEVKLNNDNRAIIARNPQKQSSIYEFNNKHWFSSFIHDEEKMIYKRLSKMSVFTNDFCLSHAAIRCPQPPVPPNSALQGTAEYYPGAILNYTCDAGHEAEGQSTRACQTDGSWTTMDLYCRRKAHRS